MNALISLAIVLFVFAIVSLPKIISVRRYENEHQQHKFKNEMLSDAEVREFLLDVTSNDPLILSTLEAAFKDPNSIPHDNAADEYRAYAYIRHSLIESNRLIEIDWAEGERAIFDYFSTLFDLYDIKISDDVEDYLVRKDGEISRGEAPQLVAALLRESAHEAGYEIIQINAYDDQYCFLLSPQETAQKWNNASLGNSIKVQIPQWNAPSDFITFKANRQRREPRSKLVRHLQKQSERAVRQENSKQIFADSKSKLLSTLKKTNYQDEHTDEFRRAMNGHGFAMALFDIAAKSLGNNYCVKDFDSKAYSLGLYYKMLAPRVQNYSVGLSIVSVPTYVMFSLIGKLSREKMWSIYAKPHIEKILDSQSDQIKRITSQFPLMTLLLEEENLTEKAHELLSQAYKIDTRKEPNLLYEAMIKDRIQYSRLLPDLHVSIYSGSPFSFIPLEILFVSTLIELPLCKDLMALRDKLSNLPIETDKGINALEQYLAITGK